MSLILVSSFFSCENVSKNCFALVTLQIVWITCWNIVGFCQSNANKKKIHWFLSVCVCWRAYLKRHTDFHHLTHDGNAHMNTRIVGYAMVEHIFTDAIIPRLNFLFSTENCSQFEILLLHFFSFHVILAGISWNDEYFPIDATISQDVFVWIFFLQWNSMCTISEQKCQKLIQCLLKHFQQLHEKR